MDYKSLSLTPLGGIGTNGINYNLGNDDWAKIHSFRFRIDTTATIGPRQFIFVFQDSKGNNLFSAISGFTNPSETAVFSGGGGLSSSTVNNSTNTIIWYNVSLPSDLMVPAGAVLVVRDGNSTDGNDAVVLASLVISI